MSMRTGVLALAGSLLLGTGTGPLLAQATSDSAKVVAGNTQFATDLYAKLAAKEGNIFCSPFSISSALAMTSAGARGKTAEQMNKVLHLDLDAARLHPAFAKLTDTLNRDGKTRVGRDGPTAFELVVANALWGQQGYAFKADFQDVLKKDYGSEMHTLDFAGATEQARTTINKWVATQTKDKIQDLLAPGILQPVTRMVLTNAIYFKANWEEKFQKEATTEQPFNVSASQTVKAPMMRQVESYGYFENAKLQAVELPYVMRRLSMILLVPKEIGGLAAVEKDVPANLGAWLGGLKGRQVDLSLPRFKMTSSFSLKRELTDMGMKDAFDPAVADFSGMTTQEKLCISEVIHKAYVDVNEEGTEAAAATAVPAFGSARPASDPPVVVKADRPFLFLIRHNGSGSILFVGRLAKPDASQ